jgi:hypothetical protein
MLLKQFSSSFNQIFVPVRFARSFRGLRDRMKEQELIPFSEQDQAFNRLLYFFKRIWINLFFLRSGDKRWTFKAYTYNRRTN